MTQRNRRVSRLENSAEEAEEKYKRIKGVSLNGRSLFASHNTRKEHCGDDDGRMGGVGVEGPKKQERPRFWENEGKGEKWKREEKKSKKSGLVNGTNFSTNGASQLRKTRGDGEERSLKKKRNAVKVQKY